jgi:hypothetical protein
MESPKKRGDIVERVTQQKRGIGNIWELSLQFNDISYRTKRPTNLEPMYSQLQSIISRNQPKNHAKITIGVKKHGPIPFAFIRANVDINLARQFRTLGSHTRSYVPDRIFHVLQPIYAVHLLQHHGLRPAILGAGLEQRNWRYDYLT